ncbi:DUF1456 family protein [Pseudomarimonas arenosa]|uniref:DUF1456 family protein n=1 Tax=Pseudomarimonas arenosa TaxID=2774145 RepID=A0AAW3ZGT5_9GAMM|nr:DUF1456 family protein [Pseudomarimonas arenosa]MBD8524645.1 DUF1456 family protein [Pseudomarimonas arenosa]
MINNDVLRSIRYMLSLSDQQVVDIIQLIKADYRIEAARIQTMTKKQGDPGFVECSTDVLAHFLDGLVIFRRGRDENRAPRPVEKQLNNNIILKKLRVAFDLKDPDMFEIFDQAEHPVTKPELGALFRDRAHKHFRPCGDAMLRHFLRGLSMRLRPEA